MMAGIDRYQQIGDLKLHYLEWGDKNARPMVLLHGLCNTAHYWDFFSENMTGEYRIIALDQRGHGDSDHVDSYGPRNYVNDLEKIGETLALEDCVIIGHSLGGINAIIYAAMHPDVVTSLVIVDIGPEIDDAGKNRMERERREEPETFVSEDEAVTYLWNLDPRQSEDFVRNQVRYSLKSDENGRLMFKHDRKLKETDLCSPEWLWDYLPQIICPVLLVHGTESDMLSTGTATAMCEAIATETIADIDHAGHNVPGDNPMAFESAVHSFLNNQ